MSLMFPRMAQNYVKHGYYPTDSATIAAIMAHLSCEQDKEITIFDPCCGEGAALYEVGQYLANTKLAKVNSIGIEIDEERAIHAKTVLNKCLHCNLDDTILQPKRVSLLFLNPPYGLTAKDDLSTSKTKRFEELFYEKTLHVMQDNAVMVLIVPEAALSEKFCARIASTLSDIAVWQAPERQFKQVVIMGRSFRGRHSKQTLQKQNCSLLSFATSPIMTCEADVVFDLPQNSSDKPFNPICVKVSRKGLSEELPNVAKTELLWTHFDSIFATSQLKDVKQSLCPLGKWHTALALASGQVNGIVKNADASRQLLIKGNTFKKKRVVTENKDGVFTTISTDVFVPMIKAIDVTPNSSEFGEIFIIK